MKASRAFPAFLGGLVGGPGVALAAFGHPRRAAAWVAAMVLSAIATTFWMPCIVGFFACYLGAAIDGARISGRTDAPPKWGAAGTMFVINLFVIICVRTFVIEGFKIPSSGMNPTIEIGDHLFVDKLSPHWRPYERGEVIVFKYPCDLDRDYIKRVVALGGDTVEVRCHVVYVNGKPVPSTLVDANATYPDYLDDDQQWITKSCTRYREQLGGHTYEVFHDVDRPREDAAHRGDARDFPASSNLLPSCANSEDRDHSIHQVLGTIAGTPSADPCAAQTRYTVPPGHVFVLGDNRNNSNDSRVWGSVPLSLIKGRVLGIWLTKNPQHGPLSRAGRID